MKKSVGRIVLALVLVCLAVGGIAAQQLVFDQQKLITPITKTLKFVFIPKVVHPWYKEVENGAAFAIAEFAKAGIKIEMKWDAPATADISEQVKKIEANISARPDGLAIACLDPATDTQVINDAFKAGIKVMTFDTDAPESNRILYVGHNGDYDDGYKSGEVIAKKIGGKGEVGVMVGSLAAPNHVNRVKGFKDAIAKFSNISIVFEASDNDDIQKSMDMTEAALQAHPNIKGIYCNNAANGIGTPRAVKNAGLAGKVVLVVDSLMPEEIQFIKDGVITMGNAQRQWDIGYWTVKYLVALNQNHTVPKIHESGAMLFTKEDLVKAGIIK